MIPTVQARLTASASALRERRGLQAVLHTLAANVAIQGIYVCTGILTARVLLAQGRGELAAIILWPQFLAYLLTLGLPVALVYRIKGHPETSGATTAAAITIGVVMGFVALLIGLVGIPYWLHQYSAENVRQAQEVMVMAPVGLVAIILLAAVQARESFGYYNLFRWVPPVLILLVLVLLALGARLTVSTAVWAYLLSGFPVFFWSVLWVRRRLRPTLRGSRAAVVPLLHYGLRAWGSDLLGTFGGQIDRLVVIGFLSPRDMGLYVVAQSLARLVSFVPDAVTPVLMPKAMGRTASDALATVGYAARRTVLAMLLVAVPLFVLGGFLLPIFYGAEFASVTSVFRLLLLEAFLAGLAAVLSQGFLALGRPGIVTMMQGLAVAIVAPLLIVLVPRLGLVGAATALLASTSIRLAVVGLLFARARIRYAKRPGATPVDVT